MTLPTLWCRAQKDEDRLPLIQKLRINTARTQWKMEFCSAFRAAVKKFLSYIRRSGDWVFEWQLVTQTDLQVFWIAYEFDQLSNCLKLNHTDNLLEQFCGSMNVTEPLDDDDDEAKNADDEKRCCSKRDNFFFVPKVPVVKRMPETGFSVGFFLISDLIGQELLGSAIVKVIAMENMELLLQQHHLFRNSHDTPKSAERFFRDATKLVLRASVRASLKAQKMKLAGGNRDILDKMLQKMLKDSSVGGPPTKRFVGNAKWGDNALRALFDFSRFFAGSSTSFSARSDGYGLNLFGESKKSGKKKVQKTSKKEEKKEKKVDLPPNSRIIGMDEGKSSNVGVCLPKAVEDRVVRLARAEASLALANTAFLAASKNLELAKGIYEAVPGPPSPEEENGEWPEAGENAQSFFSFKSADWRV